MEKGLMVEQLVNHYTDGNKAMFARILGVQPQVINTWITRNSFNAELIFAKCEGVSAEWLLSGEGDMIQTKQNADTGENEEIARLRADNKRLEGHLADLRAILGLSGENERFSVQITTNKK